nr:E3 ubiquitin-protein ligase TTC3-like [Lytechinus pictus]
MADLFEGETVINPEHLLTGGRGFRAGIYRRGPNGTVIRCSGEYIKQALKEDEEKKEREKKQAMQREKAKTEKELAAYSHPDIKPKLKSCKCGRYHATCEARDVVEIWNKHLREARRMHETNLRIVLFAPLLYNRSTLAPKWQQWMRKLDLIIDDSAPLERKKEVFFRLDELDKVLEFIHTRLSTMKDEDYDQMTWLLEEVEKVDELQVAMEVAKTNKYFVTFYDNLKTRKKMKESRVSRLMALVTIKQFCQYLKTIIIHYKELLRTFITTSEKDEEDMNVLKDRGNHLYSNNRFRNAHEMYTKALAIGVFNHILYGNRCQTSLHMEDFWDALWDARRAITISPDWQKGHYRYAQSFFELKDIDRALRENKRGQKLVGDSGQEIEQLQNQATLFSDEKKRLVNLNSKKHEVPDLVSGSETDSDSDSDHGKKPKKPVKTTDLNRDLQRGKLDFEKKKLEEAQREMERERQKFKEEMEKKARREQERKEEREKRIREEREQRRRLEADKKKFEEDERRKTKELKKEVQKMEREHKELERDNRERLKKEEKERDKRERLKKEEKERHGKQKEKQAKRDAEIARQQLEQMLKENERLAKERIERNAIEKCLADASLALVSGQSRQAVTLYHKAADLLKATNKEYGGMHEADYIVFLYAQATAYLRSGIPSEINEALARFENIGKEFPSMRNGLPFYGLATSLYKLNRFHEALDPIEKSLFIATHFEHTIHTWPGTSTNIEETEKGKLETALKELEHWCKHPPSPDATCRYVDCTTKREMYLSDLDFKGYIKVKCSERCYIDYHINCWKALKNERNITGGEREALKTPCSTPDCLGTLSDIKVIGANGLLKTEAKVEKPPKPPKDDTKKKNTQKPNKDQKKGKKFKKQHHSDSSKVEKGQGDAEGQAGHGQTTEGAHAAKEDATSKSAPGVNKPRAGSDAGIAMATDSAAADGAVGGQKGDGAEEEEEMKPEATYVLKRDDIEERKVNKVKPKKSRKPVVFDEEAASNIVQIEFAPASTRRRYGADDAEELQERMNRGWQSRLTTSDDHPFAIPSHLQDAARGIDAAFQEEPSIIIPETDEEKSQKMGLFLHFTDIFSNNGPLHLEDPILIASMEHLTFEHQELLAKRGGLKPFLRESKDFAIVGDYASVKSDAQKCKDIAVLNGYQEEEASDDAAGYTLNPDSAPFIPKTLNSDLSIFQTTPMVEYFESKGLVGYMGLPGVRRPVFGLDSFEGSDSDDYDKEDESDSGDSLASSSDDDDEEDDSGDDDEDSTESFHEASSDLHASNYDGIDSELYESTLQGNISALSDSKVDGIDDEDYHWEDHYSSKELDEVNDVIIPKETDDAVIGNDTNDVPVHERTEVSTEQSHPQHNDEGLTGNTGSNNNSTETKDNTESTQDLAVQDSMTKSPIPPEMDNAAVELDEDRITRGQSEPGQNDSLHGGATVISDTHESVDISENSESEGAGTTPAGLASTVQLEPSATDSVTSGLSEGSVKQSLELDEDSSDDGTSVDQVLNLKPSDDNKEEEAVEAVEVEVEVKEEEEEEVKKETEEAVGASTSKTEDSSILTLPGSLVSNTPPGTLVSNPPPVNNDLKTPSNTQGQSQTPESNKSTLSESDYEKMFEKRMQQWKEQHPPSPVHEQRSFGTNTDERKDQLEYLEEKLTLFRRSLEQAKREKKQMEDNMARYHDSVNKSAEKEVIVWKRKHQEIWDQYRDLDVSKSLLTLKYNELEDEHKPCNSKIKKYDGLKERFDKLVLASAEETESLKGEIGVLRSSVRDKEKVNKTLDKQSKKLMYEKQELQDAMSKLQSEMAIVNEERLTAMARRAQTEMELEETRKIPKELKEAKHALEVRLKAKEEEAVKSLDRACKAESQFLHLFMSKELKPLEEACKEAEYHIQTIANILQNNPMMEEHVRAIRSMWQDCLATNQRAVSKAQNEYQAQMISIQNGGALDAMKPVEVPAPYKPEGLVKGGGFGAGSSPTGPPSMPSPATMTQPGMGGSGSWLMSGPRQGGADPRMQAGTPPVVDPQEGMMPTSMMEEVLQNSGGLCYLSVVLMLLLLLSPHPMILSPQKSAVPPNMQHAQHQMQMSQQQVARNQQLAAMQHQQQQMLAARQQFMEQQVARPKNSFERIMLRLHGIYSSYNKVQLTGFLKDVRTSNNGSLSGLSVDDIIRRVGELVRQRQRETAGNASQRMQSKGFANQQGMMGGHPTAPPVNQPVNQQQPKRSSYHPAPTPSQPAWTTVGHIQKGLNWHKELVDGEEGEEDPCVICHDEMSGDDILEIECGHIFHGRCIQEWLKQQNTCPTCRNYTILKNDYPTLHK